jgi:hypothetical protein
MSRYREKFMDPEGKRFGLPTYPWHCAPEGLLTRRQLRDRDLSPVKQHPCGQILWPAGRDRLTGEPRVRVAYLYRLDLARPVREMTPGMWRRYEAMMLPRRTCRSCGEVFDFDLSRKYNRTCWPCLVAEGVTP